MPKARRDHARAAERRTSAGVPRDNTEPHPPRDPRRQVRQCGLLTHRTVRRQSLKRNAERRRQKGAPRAAAPYILRRRRVGYRLSQYEYR